MLKRFGVTQLSTALAALSLLSIGFAIGRITTGTLAEVYMIVTYLLTLTHLALLNGARKRESEALHHLVSLYQERTRPPDTPK